MKVLLSCEKVHKGSGQESEWLREVARRSELVRYSGNAGNAGRLMAENRDKAG